MTYNPNIPQPDDNLSVSQGDLLNNFTDLNTKFSINHVSLTDTTSDTGKHKYVSFVEQASNPETVANEQILFTKDSSGKPELFARAESNGSAYQLTKGGYINVGLLPVVAVNFSQTGAIQGSALNVSSVTRVDSAGRYRVNFSSALPDNNYFWSVSGFDNSTNPVISQVTNTSTYGDKIKTTSIEVNFVNQNNTSITGLTRACVICWRVQ